jgi:DNA-binding SARP family transcriptional activator
MPGSIDFDSNRRLYILHPRLSGAARYMHLFTEFSPMLYVRMAGHDLPYADVEQQIQAACEEQIESKSLSDVTMLVLDDVDVVSESALVEIVQWLLFRCHVDYVALIARDISYRMFEHSNLQREVQLLPVDDTRMLYDYSRLTDQDSHLLEVHAFGSGRVYLNGEAVDMQAGGTLPQRLFFFLIDRRMATRNEIFSHLWSDQDVKEATNVFHVTKRKISEILGVSITEYIGGYYRVSSVLDVRYDVELFRRYVQNAAMDTSDESLRMLELALSLYRYPFLSGIDDTDWITERRDELEQLRAEVLVDIAGYHRQREAVDTALGFYIRALQYNMTREDIVAHVMRLYLLKGEAQEALRVYNRTRQLLLDTLGVEPGNALRQLAEEATAKNDDSGGKM